MGVGEEGRLSGRGPGTVRGKLGWDKVGQGGWPGGNAAEAAGQAGARALGEGAVVPGGSFPCIPTPPPLPVAQGAVSGAEARPVVSSMDRQSPERLCRPPHAAAASGASRGCQPGLARSGRPEPAEGLPQGAD